jgi:hypothetical protein
MCINKILIELQHTGSISEQTKWQYNFLSWKCEQFQENAIYGNFHKIFKEDIRRAIMSFLGLGEQMQYVPQEHIGETSKEIIHQAIQNIREMVTKLDELKLWQKGWET